MTAKTSPTLKEKFLALVTMLLELVRDGKRKIEAVLRVLQVIKEDPNFEERLFGEVEAEVEVVPKPKT